MKAFIISDSEYRTHVFKRLDSQLKEYLTARGFDNIEEAALGRDSLAFCKGCFGCWVKTPGECVIGDGMAEINRTYMNSDFAVYLCPVVFGQFSANIKNAVDRWLPNILPFFIVREDGSTMHPARYGSYPMQIMIGYGDSLDAEDKQLFADIIKKHRRNVEAFVYESDADLAETLDGYTFKRAEGKL
jgi:multimeric flavodoxin WrbA